MWTCQILVISITSFIDCNRVQYKIIWLHFILPLWKKKKCLIWYWKVWIELLYLFIFFFFRKLICIHFRCTHRLLEDNYHLVSRDKNNPNSNTHTKKKKPFSPVYKSRMLFWMAVNHCARRREGMLTWVTFAKHMWGIFSRYKYTLSNFCLGRLA